MPQTFPSIPDVLDNAKETANVTSWLAVLPNLSNKLSHYLRVQHNSKTLQTKRDQPRSSNTNMAKTRMAKRTTGLMLRVLGCSGGGAHTGTKYSMPAYGCRANHRGKAFLCKETKENSAPLGSIFPTPNEVMQSLSSASQFFVKADLLQGYHQIALSDKSHNLFCFALEDGLYPYTRAPMGYPGSSHYFN